MSPKLIIAITNACDLLCESPKGSDQWERGTELREALQDAIASDMLRARKRKTYASNLSSQQPTTAQH